MKGLFDPTKPLKGYKIPKRKSPDDETQKVHGLDFVVDEENYSESDDGSNSDSSPTTNPDLYKDLSKSSENKTKRAMYDMFDPLADERKSSWVLSHEQETFLKKFFITFQKEDIIREKIMKDTPIPDSEMLRVLKLGEEMIDLLPIKIQEQVRKGDETQARVQAKLTQTMGPLGKLWSKMETARLEQDG